MPPKVPNTGERQASPPLPIVLDHPPISTRSDTPWSGQRPTLWCHYQRLIKVTTTRSCSSTRTCHAHVDRSHSSALVGHAHRLGRPSSTKLGDRAEASDRTPGRTTRPTPTTIINRGSGLASASTKEPQPRSTARARCRRAPRRVVSTSGRRSDGGLAPTTATIARWIPRGDDTGPPRETFASDPESVLRRPVARLSIPSSSCGHWRPLGPWLCSDADEPPHRRPRSHPYRQENGATTCSPNYD